MEWLLRECPFENVQKDIGHTLYLDRETFQVSCTCGAKGPLMAYTEESGVKGWNTRSNGVANTDFNPTQSHELEPR